MIELAVGVATTCALTATDEVWCWGRNEAHAVDPTSDALFIRDPVRVHLPTRP